MKYDYGCGRIPFEMAPSNLEKLIYVESKHTHQTPHIIFDGKSIDRERAARCENRRKGNERLHSKCEKCSSTSPNVNSIQRWHNDFIWLRDSVTNLYRRIDAIADCELFHSISHALNKMLIGSNSESTTIHRILSHSTEMRFSWTYTYECVRVCVRIIDLPFMWCFDSIVS